MKVKLIRFTDDALNLLLGTKNTRMANKCDVAEWSDVEKIEHLNYMLGTIKSSWEFVDYIFEIENVSRSFTQQLERTRHGSFAEQTLRAVDVRESGIYKPESITNVEQLDAIWNNAILTSMSSYEQMIDGGAAIQDARGALPINIQTNITCKFNLRTLHEMSQIRLCVRTQGEYQNVFRMMRDKVLEIHTWAEPMLQVHCVTHGTCAFPRYGKKECPVYLPEMDNTAVKEKAKALFWSIRHEAAPIAVNGKAM